MFDQLRAELESAAFLVARRAGEKEVHSKILNCLVILGQLARENSIDHQTEAEIEVAEVNKVSRRLKMWAKRQNQYNSKILNAFLTLKRRGHSKITEADLDAEIGPNTWFASNFAQMKCIAEKNHGKVFQQTGEFIEIWQPVSHAVKNYEKAVFR